MRATELRSTVTGVFESRAAARQAVAELQRDGFTETQIGIVSGGPADPVVNDTGDQASSGAVAGAAAGAGIGAMWGLGIVAGVLPAIGPAIAGGTLAAILSSAAAGAATAGIAGLFLGYGMTEEEAAYYENEIRSGRSVVTVTAGARAEEAYAILHRNGASETQF